VSLALHHLPKTTIAAIPGAVAGAGLSIALSCDLRIASSKAIITTAFSKIGASGDFGGSWFLTQLVGPSRAKQLYLLSDRVSPEEAERLGVVNLVAPAEEFEATWLALAKRVGAGPTLAYRYIKENVNRAASGADLAACLDAEAAAMVKTMRSADHREAAAAFVEKRTAVFHGN
jgi:2-(1,2-epoxy-1,2-dihydrophenyl)acetyl-CoA isomerase